MYKIYETVKIKRKEKLIPGTYDLVFKAIMTSEREYLADIVSGISGIDKEKIMKNAVIKSNEYIVENIDESKKTSDLVIEVKENIINIEMNNFNYNNLNKRNNRYLYKLVSISENNSIIIQINLDNFDNGNEEISKYVLYDVKNDKEDSDSVIKYRVNLALIKKKYYNKEKLSKLEKELLMLTIDNKKELDIVSKGDKVMIKVNKKLNELSDDKYLCLMYDRDEFKEWEFNEYKKTIKEQLMEEKEQLMEEKERIKKEKEQVKKEEERVRKEEERVRKEKEQVRKEKEQLMKELENKAMEDGTSIGIKQDIEQGRNDEKISIAKNMIKLGIKIDDISKATGLKVDEIKNLK